ncbi:NAD(P)/FAD-dependent oxidoreductase [Sphingomonas sp. TDK1]|uniref:NAD(P)/FAD-dependent oxidoreductase n=1 Tax=Sphingomonas sp. TDK1 TaxID=453247 RepID=UPI0007D95CF6|nr:FAD-binding oxidoreductase [Sphingomonas sp. TDK1]OAN58820.1 FAD-dependent oxidoreductase [Sphingomonas sp. TDK1]
MTRYDIAIVGAGIAGASLAAELAPHARVLLLEAEDRPGYHATGRSAAFWSETYGGPDIQPLTTASGPMLRDNGFLDPLGELHLARAGDAARAEAFLAAFEGSGVVLDRVDPQAMVPGLRAEWAYGVHEPGCAYIDVAALHQHFLARARAAGAELHCSAALGGAARAGGTWQLQTRSGRFAAEVLVNAAGAWADQVAELAGAAPIGIRAYRRTMVQLRTDPSPPPGCPLVSDLAGSFYFKPEAGGRLWLTPHDEVDSPACDAAPEEIDVATAIHRFEQVVDWRVAALEHRWAGLRSFAPDRRPVYGFDPATPGFFWCAGQGGFGIQTAPAAARLACQLLRQETTSLDSDRYLPDRFRD